MKILKLPVIWAFFTTCLIGCSAWAQSDCATSSGAITSTTTCYVQPDEYYLTIYKLGLCTAQPTAPASGVAADLSSCTTVFENTSGSRVKVIKGTSSALTGTMTRPSNGTYTYGYVIAEPQFEIKTAQTFSTTRTAMSDFSTGTSCWSTLGTAYVYSSSTTYPAKCGNSVSGNDVTTQKMNSFSSSSASSSATFTTTAGTVSAYLVKSDLSLGTGTNTPAMGDITRLLGIAPMPVTVAATTAGMNSSFNVSQGSTLTMYTGGAITGGIVYFGGGPFAVLMTLQ